MTGPFGHPVRRRTGNSGVVLVEGRKGRGDPAEARGAAREGSGEGCAGNSGVALMGGGRESGQMEARAVVRRVLLTSSWGRSIVLTTAYWSDPSRAQARTRRAGSGSGPARRW